VHTQRNATGYFNVLNEEGRVVVGALLAPDPDVSLLETMPEQKHELHDRPFVLR
jgi:NADH dehydrogenase [ubiquinone] 1 alpha subcomplex assembly factor 3